MLAAFSSATFSVFSKSVLYFSAKDVNSSYSAFLFLYA
jgi:hypothetical protein